jgi:hypothetical protein
MAMFHLGKVQLVFSPKDRNIDAFDSSTQAIVKMWDENVVIADVEAGLSDKIKVSDFVLVDFSPLQGTSAPRMLVSKILKGDTAKKAWKIYDERLKHKKESSKPSLGMPFPQQQIT